MKVAIGKHFLLEKTCLTYIDRSVEKNRPTHRSLILRPYGRNDRTSVFRLLSILPSLYPKGETWLDHRLDAVIQGKARCNLVTMGNVLVGVTVETPKGKRRLKLSTILVHPFFRGKGIGNLLLDNCRNYWMHSKVDQVYVTVASHIAPNLSSLLHSFDFKANAVEKERYGEGRDEVVFLWNGR